MEKKKKEHKINTKTCIVLSRLLSSHSTIPTPTYLWGSLRECRHVDQLATGITSGNCACRTCRRGSSCGCRGMRNRASDTRMQACRLKSVSWNASFTAHGPALAVIMGLWQQRNHTHLTTLCLGLSRWASTKNVKPIWIYWSNGQWTAVALVGPYASLHSTADR